MAQNTISGKVSKIIGGNEFILIVENTKYQVLLKDTEVLNPAKKHTAAREYLRDKILNKKVVLIDIEKKSANIVIASVMYNCTTYEDIEYDDIPCSEANILIVEMLQKKLLKYSGDNEFLKKL